VFRVQKAGDYLKSTQRAFFKNMEPDWVVMGIYRTSVEAHKDADTWMLARMLIFFYLPTLRVRKRCGKKSLNLRNAYSNN
jgi:hypothetical protein